MKPLQLQDLKRVVHFNTYNELKLPLSNKDMAKRFGKPIAIIEGNFGFACEQIYELHDGSKVLFSCYGDGFHPLKLTYAIYKVK